MLTNKHVIEGSSYIVVRNGLGKVREVETIKIPQNKDEDLAILILKNAYPKNYSLSINDIKELPQENKFMLWAILCPLY